MYLTVMAKSKFKPHPDRIRSWIEANFDYKSRKNGSEYLICNPFDGDNGYNFNISIEKAICHDWRGNEWAGGKPCTFLRFVQVYRNCSFIEAYREVCGKDASLEYLYTKIVKSKEDEDEGEQDDDDEYEIKLPDGSAPILDYADTLNGKMLISWLGDRGVDRESINRHNLHFHGMNVVWPYYEFGSLVYWQERNRVNKRFKFPEEKPNCRKSLFLYGFDMVEPGKHVVIVEAIFDYHAIELQCLASGGASLSGQQIRKVRMLNPVDGVILAPDNDKAGISSIIANYKLLSPYFKKLYYSVPPKIDYADGQYTKDWNDLGHKKVMKWSDIKKEFENNIVELDKKQAVRLMVTI